MSKVQRTPVAAQAAAPVDKLARQVVKERVQAALDYWKKVAHHKSPRVKDVHQLRVWCRRAIAALQLFAAALPAEATDDLIRFLNKARKGAGKARDCDVLKDTLDKEARELLAEVLETLKDQRHKATTKLRKGYEKKVKSGQLHDSLKAVQKKLHTAAENGKPTEAASFGPWFQQQFGVVAATFLKQLRIEKLVQRRIHALRIEGKRVRYALEIGLPSLPKQIGKPLYAALEQLQQQLGEICDDQAMAEQYRELASELKPADRTALNQTCTRHQQQAQAGFTKFTRWWKSPTGRKKLLQLLDSILLQPAPKSRPPQRRKSQVK